MSLAIHIVMTFVLLIAGAWAFLPGGFGLANFRKVHGGAVGLLAMLCWWLLLLIHPVAIGMIWHGGRLILWLPLVAAMHLLFFGLFGRNVGTR